MLVSEDRLSEKFKLWQVVNRQVPATDTRRSGRQFRKKGFFKLQSLARVNP